MNLVARERWLLLGRINVPIDVGFSLCNLCKHAEWWGDCCDADLRCTCGIEKIADRCENAWSGDDCWAFRPKYVYEDCVDALGMCLAGVYPDWDSLRKVISQ